jgi:hypothetical protein
MKIHQNYLTVEQINNLRNQFDEYANSNQLTFKYWITHKDTLKEVFNSDADQLIQQARRDISRDSMGQCVRDLLRPIYDVPLKTAIYAVRSHNPIGIHTDSDDWTYQVGRSFIIPLTFDDRIVTVVWDKIVTVKELGELIQKFADDPSTFEKFNDVSKQYKLNNCWFGDPSLTDYLPLLGIATWKLGTIIEFNRQTMHASNNYTDFVPYKDYILIHTDE